MHDAEMITEGLLAKFRLYMLCTDLVASCSSGTRSSVLYNCECAVGKCLPRPAFHFVTSFDSGKKMEPYNIPRYCQPKTFHGHVDL